MATLITDCGHEYETNHAWPDDPTGATTDCKVCDGLLYLSHFDEEGRLIGRNFHVYMHEQDERWPADGAGTGYVSF